MADIIAVVLCDLTYIRMHLQNTSMSDHDLGRPHV